MTISSGTAGSDSAPEGVQEFVSRRLTEAIVTGSLASGEKLSPTKIGADLGVSHIPVREALAGLEADGYVRRVPRVGFFVASLSVDYIEDVYRWRAVLEDEAHRIAVPKLTAADLARMRQIDKKINRAGESRSNRFIDLNREFHFVAFERAESEILLRFLNHLWDASSRYQNMMDVTRPRTKLREQHSSILEAFEARDVEAINAHMAEHRALTLEAIRKMAASNDSDIKTSATGA